MAHDQNAGSFIAFQTPPFPYYLECGFRQYAVGDVHPNRHSIGVFDLLFVTKGSLFIGEEDKEWLLSAGETLILLPDRYHYAVEPCETETDFYWIHFQAAEYWQESDDNGKTGWPIALPKTWNVSDPEHMTRLIARLLELSVESRTMAYWEEQQTFWEILRLMNEGGSGVRASHAATLAEKTEVYLKQNYQKEITNRTLSDALHFHPNYIARCMKEMFDCTPMEFLHHYRLEQAKLLLLKTEWPVSKIAEFVGFRFTPYFSSCFSKKIGVSPLAYRKKYS